MATFAPTLAEVVLAVIVEPSFRGFRLARLETCGADDALYEFAAVPQVYEFQTTPFTSSRPYPRSTSSTASSSASMRPSSLASRRRESKSTIRPKPLLQLLSEG